MSAMDVYVVVVNCYNAAIIMSISVRLCLYANWNLFFCCIPHSLVVAIDCLVANVYIPFYGIAKCARI